MWMKQTISIDMVSVQQTLDKVLGTEKYLAFTNILRLTINNKGHIGAVIPDLYSHWDCNKVLATCVEMLSNALWVNAIRV